MSYPMRRSANQGAPLFIVALLAVLNSTCSGHTPALPNLSSIGSHIEGARLFLQKDQNQRKGKVYPSRILMDVYEGKLEGFVLYYKPEVTFDLLVRSVDASEKDNVVIAEMRKYGVSCWRNEKGRYALQVASSDDEQFGSQLVCTWIDRKSPPTQQVKEMLKGIEKSEEWQRSSVPKRNPDPQVTKVRRLR